MIKLLGLNGSLRTNSSNGRLLLAATRLAPREAPMTLAPSLDRLPHFNPDTATVQLSEHRALANFVDQVRFSQGVVVSAPVYAGGYPGVLKNALDWLVGTDAFVDKPFLVLNAANRVPSVAESLATVMRTMSGLEIANTSINLLGSDVSVDDILANPEQVAKIKTTLSEFASAIEATTSNATDKD